MSLELHLVGENHFDPKYSERVIGFLDHLKPDVAGFESGKVHHYYAHPELLDYCKSNDIRVKSIDIATNIDSIMILLDNPFVKSWKDLILDKSLKRSNEEISRLLSEGNFDEKSYHQPLEEEYTNSDWYNLVRLICGCTLREKLMSRNLRKLSDEKSIVAFIGTSHVDPIYNHLRDLNPKTYVLCEADSLSKSQRVQTLEAYA
ncbi:MAG TPA: RNA methyltransferase [Nanoarchaeota archaeon]|nr:MAG: hypothetical protein UY38_C0006G0007 [Parcubacteria group bacterium GW2011_GWB1_49_12]HIH18154.1 RNA methyltransferase [Nanoarchaeota archaeon]HIH34131.1 RNA methyltransferase [Nanoarchaeota archaeon]HIH51309.1 RNA methyltransferase [Nanoarchaeota archaeon]HIH65648.1 RNA methyltransferase [Nanoarchaeota archaeon]